MLYHTLEGVNRFLGIPRRVASIIHAAREALELYRVRIEFAEKFEAQALMACLDNGLLEYGEVRRSWGEGRVEGLEGETREERG